MLDRTIAPKIIDPIDFTYTLPPYQFTKLDNEIPMYWLQGGSQEVIQIEWVLTAGLWHEERTGIAQTVAALLKNGTSDKSAFQINEAIESYGATLRVIANNDFVTISLQTLTKHLAQVLPIVLAILTDAQFPQMELDVFKQNAIQRLKLNLKRSDFVANRTIDALLFGSTHPYGKYTEEADIKAVTVQDLKIFYQTYYQPEHCKIFVAGNFDDDTLQLIQSTFGKQHWPQKGSFSPIKSHSLLPSADKVLHIENDPKGVQGAIRLAKLFPQRNDPDYPALMILNTLFGGYFGSRLMSNIREEKGYTYGIYAQLFSFQHAGALLIASDVNKDVANATIEEVKKELQLIQNEIIDEEELLLVKNYILGNLLGDLDGPFSIMLRWKTLILNNLDIHHFNNNIAVYKSVNSSKLQALARQYYDPASFYELIVI